MTHRAPTRPARAHVPYLREAPSPGVQCIATVQVPAPLHLPVGTAPVIRPSPYSRTPSLPLVTPSQARQPPQQQLRPDGQAQPAASCLRRQQQHHHQPPRQQPCTPNGQDQMSVVPRLPHSDVAPGDPLQMARHQQPHHSKPRTLKGQSQVVRHHQPDHSKPCQADGRYRSGVTALRAAPSLTVASVLPYAKRSPCCMPLSYAASAAQGSGARGERTALTVRQLRRRCSAQLPVWPRPRGLLGPHGDAQSTRSTTPRAQCCTPYAYGKIKAVRTARAPSC